MKAAKRISGLLLASAVGITTAFSGVTYFAPVAEVYAANSVTVTTQAELNKALSDSSVTAVTIRSDAKKLKIKKGNYSAIDLSVIAANTKVVNAGSFNSVTIRNAKAFVEKASGNYIRTIDGSVKIAIKKAAKKTSIRIDKEKCVTAINVAGSLEKLDITKSDCKTTLNVTGSVDEIIERAASNTVVKGSSKDSIETTLSGEGAVFKTGVPASVEVSAKADITFEKGAENSSVKSSGNGSSAKITNNSDSGISVSDGTANGTVASGSSATVSDGANTSDGGSSGSTDTTATGAIKSVTQVTFDEAVLSFASAVDSSTVSTATVGINGSVGAATSVTVAEDGLSASVVYAYAEDTAYTFAINGLDGTAGSFFYGIALTARQWLRDRGKSLAVFVQPFVIGFLFSQIFSKTSSLWTVAFAVVLCSNWFSLSLSIREIVQEKNTVKGEFRKGAGTLPYLAAKFTLPAFVSIVQTAIVYAFIAYRVPIHNDIPQLAAIIATATLPAIAMGLLVSSLSKNSGQANAFLPLLIIPQVALAGALVPFDQMQQVGKWISYVVWSRYSQSSLLNFMLEQPDDVWDKGMSLLLALLFFIITATILYRSKKAK